MLSNPRSSSVVALLRLFESAEERKKTGQFFVEGMRFLARAQEQPSRIVTCVAAPDLLTHPFARRQWETIQRRDLPRLALSAEIFRSLSLVEECQGIGAVVRQRWDTLDRIRPEAGLCWLMLDTVRSAGNLGTILRTADAVGAAGLILLGDQIEPYAPRVVRASMGAIFHLRYVRTTLRAFTAWKRKHDCHWVATSPSATGDYRDLVYRAPTILYMGGERSGIPVDISALCDDSVRIPMVGGVDSLNLGIATGVLLYEIFHQRRADRNVTTVPGLPEGVVK